MVARGRVWTLLGLLRLHLAAPPPGADPAAKYALLRQHTLSLLSLRVEPELAVRRQYQRLPGGWLCLRMWLCGEVAVHSLSFRRRGACWLHSIYISMAPPQQPSHVLTALLKK